MSKGPVAAYFLVPKESFEAFIAKVESLERDFRDWNSGFDCDPKTSIADIVKMNYSQNYSKIPQILRFLFDFNSQEVVCVTSKNLIEQFLTSQTKGHISLLFFYASINYESEIFSDHPFFDTYLRLIRELKPLYSEIMDVIKFSVEKIEPTKEFSDFNWELFYKTTVPWKSAAISSFISFSLIPKVKMDQHKLYFTDWIEVGDLGRFFTIQKSIRHPHHIHKSVNQYIDSIVELLKLI